MTFLHPEFLYYMLPPLFLLFALLLTQKESQAEFFSKEVMEKLRVSANTLTLKARNALFLLVGFFTIIALAQPVIKEAKVEVKAKSADITIALDISDSMLAQDVYPNRLEAAKQKALALLEEAKNERIGVVAFAKESYLVSPLSFDTAAVAFLLRQLDTSSITEKGTDFLSVLDVVQKSQKEQEKKILLLLSDGGDRDDFSEEIAFAKKHGIRVFVLGIGTKKGAPIRLHDGTFLQHNGTMILTKLNDHIATLATKTGGVYIEQTTSFEDIKAMFGEIVRQDAKKELKSQEIERTKPLFYYPLAVAMLLLLIATSSFGGGAKSLFVALAILGFHQEADAGVFDFMELREAKKAYESGEFDKAAQLYETHATKSQNPQSYYNAANAYYKQGKYKEAAETYKKAAFEDEESRAKNLYNLGNAYAKSGDLQKALTSYEESLKIKEEKETQKNLEIVKEALQKHQKEEQSSKENEQKQEKEKKESDKKGQKEGKSGDKDEPKDKESQGEQKPEDAKEKKEEKKATDTKKGDVQEQKSDDGEAKAKDEKGMSEAEERKWIEMLNKNANSYMYKLSDETTQKSTGEKPW